MFFQAPCHDNVWGERYSDTLSQAWHSVNVIGRCHIQAALLYTLQRRLDRPWSWSECCEKKITVTVIKLFS
jgi:hypothetical protein